MIKKSAISGDYIINILDSGTVQVLKKCDVEGSQSYSACPNTLSALREIAASVGFEINEK